MEFNSKTSFINNSDEYMLFASLFEDFEIIDKLARQRIEENNFTAAMRCMMIMRLILDELKQYVLK